MAKKIKKKSRVIVFSTPTCHYCTLAKKYLRRHGINFREVDISRNPSAARDIKRRTGQMGVPVLEIGGKMIVGFDKPKINRLLDIRD